MAGDETKNLKCSKMVNNLQSSLLPGHMQRDKCCNLQRHSPTVAVPDTGRLFPGWQSRESSYQRTRNNGHNKSGLSCFPFQL